MTTSDEMNEAQEQLISLIHDSNARDICNRFSLPQFWCNVMVQYPDITHFALKLFVPFPSTYLFYLVDYMCFVCLSNPSWWPTDYLRNKQ